MRIFLAGAGGAIGRRLTPLLVKSGHQVAGLLIVLVGFRFVVR